MIRYHGNIRSPIYVLESLETQELLVNLDIPPLFSQLKQLYHNLIYPYLSYWITSWGSAFTAQIKKVQPKQNHVIRLMFFATLYGPDTDSALPLLNLLDLLTVKNIIVRISIN